jgi:hypothetical protein
LQGTIEKDKAWTRHGQDKENTRTRQRQRARTRQGNRETQRERETERETDRQAGRSEKPGRVIRDRSEEKHVGKIKILFP